MPVKPGYRSAIEYQISMISPENTEMFLRSICTNHFKQEFALELPLEALEAFIDKCTPGAISYLMGKLTEFKFDAGKARVQAILDKDPNRN